MIFYESHRSKAEENIYHQKDKNLNFGLHLHNSFEFICVFNGELNIVIDERVFTLRRGDGCIILPNQVHSYETVSFSDSYLCVFSNSYVYDFYEKVKDNFAITPVFRFNNAVMTERLEDTSNSAYLIKSYLYYIIDLFSRNTSFEKRNSKLFTNIGRILNFIEQNFSRDISVRDIAKDIGYDYHYLTNVISKTLNTTFKNLLNEYRIGHALTLLKATSLRITDISSECGFDSLCSFNRNFKSVTGKTPTDYKRQ